MKIFKLLKFAFLIIFIFALSFGYRLFGVRESDHQTKVSKIKHFFGIGFAEADFPHDGADSDSDSDSDSDADGAADGAADDDS